MCAVSSMTHRGQRSKESVEFWKARHFCFGHRKFYSKLQERTFIGTPGSRKTFVEAAVEKIVVNVKTLTDVWSQMSDLEDPKRLVGGAEETGGLC
jgi:hypothetical protein